MACRGVMGSANRDLVGKPEGRRHLEGPGVDKRIILERFIHKQVADSWKHVNKPWNSIKCEICLD